MYRGNFSIRSVPQVIARSGTALLHFFSDDAYNMSGFNLSYKMNACPSDNEEIECSGHGKCKEGFCICDPLYSGEACNIAACPNNCMDDKNHGACSTDEERFVFIVIHNNGIYLKFLLVSILDAFAKKVMVAMIVDN